MSGCRRGIGCAIALAAAAVSAGAAPARVPAHPAAGPVATFQCEFAIRTATYGVIQRGTLTRKGKLLRYQPRTGGGLRLLYIRNRHGTYHINLHTNDGALWTPELAQRIEDRLMLPGPQGDPRAFFKVVHARRTGRERVDGRATDVWTYTLPAEAGKQQVVHVFVDLKTGRPLRAETRAQIAPNRSDAVTVDYSCYRWDFPLPDSFFDLPPGAKIVDLNHPEAKPLIVPVSQRRFPDTGAKKKKSATD
jgi:hypothetical protein